MRRASVVRRTHCTRENTRGELRNWFNDRRRQRDGKQFGRTMTKLDRYVIVVVIVARVQFCLRIVIIVAAAAVINSSRAYAVVVGANGDEKSVLRLERARRLFIIFSAGPRICVHPSTRV